MPWRVRLRDPALDRVLGAGLLVDEGRVLTCEHVIRGAATLLADLLGMPGQPAVPATVAVGGLVPEQEDGTGDLALLELAEPVARRWAAPLRRLRPTLGRPVWTCGFPSRREDGLWVQATLGGRAGPRGEWVQLDRCVGRPTIDAGFSGSAVTEETSGAVIGMVVARAFLEQDSGSRHLLSYMLPVDSILGHLPQLKRLVHGSPAIDPSMRAEQQADPARGPGDFAEQLAGWLAGKDPSPVRMVVVGDAADHRVALLRRALPSPTGSGRAGTPPPAGRRRTPSLRSAASTSP